MRRWTETGHMTFDLDDFDDLPDWLRELCRGEQPILVLDIESHFCEDSGDYWTPPSCEEERLVVGATLELFDGTRHELTKRCDELAAWFDTEIYSYKD